MHQHYMQHLQEKGYFDKELLKGFRKVESNLQGHPDMKKGSWC